MFEDITDNCPYYAELVIEAARAYLNNRTDDNEIDLIRAISKYDKAVVDRQINSKKLQGDED